MNLAKISGAAAPRYVAASLYGCLLLVLMAAREPRISAARLIPALSIVVTLGFCIFGGIPRTPW